MEDGVDARERAPDVVGVADVTHPKLDVAAEVGRAGSVGTVNLRREVIEDADRVSVVKELIGEVRAKEACAARDENVAFHKWHILSSDVVTRALQTL
jgi:hypothetical protein